MTDWGCHVEFSKGAVMLKGFFMVAPQITVVRPSEPSPPERSALQVNIFLGYDSDVSDSKESKSEAEDDIPQSQNKPIQPTFHVQAPPPLKCHQLVIPAQTACHIT